MTDGCQTTAANSVKNSGIVVVVLILSARARTAPEVENTVTSNEAVDHLSTSTRFALHENQNLPVLSAIFLLDTELSGGQREQRDLKSKSKKRKLFSPPQKIRLF